MTQILQVNFDDFIPKWQIIVEQEEDVDELVKHWLSPSTLWEGRSVIGFMAETCLSDLSTVGFKHFNPTWSSPTTSVYQNWEPVTFGMPAYHLCDDTEHDKDALVSQSPTVVFKSAVVRQALGFIHSLIVLLSFPADQRNHQCVICPEQECGSLVYHADQNKSMIEVLKLDQDEFWQPRAKAFPDWYTKPGAKTQKEAWTWEGKDRGSSKHAQSVPTHPADRENPEEQGLRWKDIGEANLDESFLYPGKATDPPCV